MNRILFERGEEGTLLSLNDERILHITRRLKRKEGEPFAAGIVEGEPGWGRLETCEDHGWRWSFTPEGDSAPLHPLTLIVGCTRPLVARRIIRDMCAMGAAAVHFCETDLNEKSYLESHIWKPGNVRTALIEGASQGTGTRLTLIKRDSSLKEAIENAVSEAASETDLEKIALDNGDKSRPFGIRESPFTRGILAIGPERGWSEGERKRLCKSGFKRLHLGPRILRTETACAAGSALMLSAMNLYR